MRIRTTKLKRTEDSIEKKMRLITEFVDFLTESEMPDGFMSASEPWCVLSEDGQTITISDGTPSVYRSIRVGSVVKESYFKAILSVLSICQDRLDDFDDDEVQGNWDGDDDVVPSVKAASKV